MPFKQIGRALLFPHRAVRWGLLPCATAFLLYTMTALDESSLWRIVSYLTAFYTLTVWCVQVPHLWRLTRTFKQHNRYLRRWSDDTHWRTNITLGGSVLYNGAYALLQLGMGIRHRSAWFYSLAAYYALLAGMRFFLVKYTRRHTMGEHPAAEQRYFRLCSRLLLPINAALSVMIFYMIHENRTVHHSEITVIAMAAYTFTALSAAIVNVIRYRRYQSPVLSAAKAVSLAAACVSMLTLENAMLNTFGGDTMLPQTRHLFLAFSGGGVSLWILAMAVYMLYQSHLKFHDTED